MPGISSERPEGVPLRLYYRLENGRTADAEVIARASLAFIAGVKELTYVLDPSVRVSVGIQGYTEGSLWEDLLLIIDRVNKEYRARPTRYGLALAALVWIMSPPFDRARDIIWQPFLDKYLPNASDEDIAEAKALIERAQSSSIAAREKQQFYREVGRDTAISGVGANIERSPPALIIGRSDFAIYSGQSTVLDSSLDRTTIGQLRVTILSPVLEVSGRRWKFATAQGEFGAVIKDRAFLERIVAGATPVRMRGGVELDVELETKEKLLNGVWTISERNVIKVINIHEPPESRQGSMFPKDGDEH